MKTLRPLWLAVMMALVGCGVAQAQVTVAEQHAWLAKAKSFDPPADFATWWSEVVADCDCEPAITFDRILWYVVTADRFQCSRFDLCAAVTDADGYIVLASRWRTNKRLVQHEMLHAVLGGDTEHRHRLWLKYRTPVPEARS